MSAYTVADEHIHVLVTALRDYLPEGAYNQATGQWVDIAALSADRLGQLLLDANIASVNARYGEDDVRIYSWQPAKWAWDEVAILKAIAGYEYQACEAPSWNSSDAKALCEGLRLAVITHLPSYEQAPWEITADSRPTHLV